MNELCRIIKNMVAPNFINMKTAINTYDKNADWIAVERLPEDSFIMHYIRRISVF